MTVQFLLRLLFLQSFFNPNTMVLKVFWLVWMKSCQAHQVVCKMDKYQVRSNNYCKAQETYFAGLCCTLSVSRIVFNVVSPFIASKPIHPNSPLH